MKIIVLILIQILIFCEQHQKSSICSPKNKNFISYLFLNSSQNQNACNLNLTRNTSSDNLNNNPVINNPIINNPINILLNQKELLTFSILNPEGEGEIDGDQIRITLPFQTNPTNLIANFTHNGKEVLVNNTPQTTSVTANNFSSPVTYTVVAENGTRANYTVTVRIPSSDGKVYVATLANLNQRFNTANIFNNITGTNFNATSTFMLANELDQERNILYIGLGAAGQNTIHTFEQADTTNGSGSTRNFSITTMTRVAGIALDKKNNRMYVVNLDAGTSNNTNRRIFRIDNPHTKSGTLTSGTDFLQFTAPDLHPSMSGIRRIEYSAKTDSLYLCEFGADKTRSREVPFTKPTGIAIDNKRDILFLTNNSTDDLSIFENASTINGSTTPTRKVTSSSLNDPFGIHYIPELNRLYIANSIGNNVVYFNKIRTLSGLQTPTISEFSATGPTDIAVDIYR